MPSKSLSFVVGSSVLVITLLGSTQVPKPRFLLRQKSIKVRTNQTFPKDLGCQVYLGSFKGGMNVLGSKDLPIFEAEGKEGRIEEARLSIGGKTTISFFRNDPDKDSYVLSFFTQNEDGDPLILFDLNVDGEWDIKITSKLLKATSKKFIRVENKWIKVDDYGRPKSKKPIAVRGRKKFVFQKKWIPIK